jgi:peptide/nickel transport system substrate-binding protein
MGTGPYTLGRWNKNSLIELKARNDQGVKVGYKTVNYKILPDPAAQIAALQTGEVHVITAIGPDQMDRVKGMPNITSGAIPTIRSAFLMVNTRNKPLDDVRVRQALNYAVDKESIVKNLFHGLVEPSPGQMITKEYAGFNEDLTAYPYDPAKAKQLLAEAGHAAGFTMTLTYPSSTYLLADKTTQVVKEQLADVGVTVKVQPEPFASWLSNMYAGKIADAVYLTYAWPTLDGLDVLRNFGPGGAQSFWTDETFGASLKSAQRTADPAAHAKAISEAAATMREQAPFTFLFPQPLTYAYSSSVGWQPRPDDWVRADEMTPR